MRISRLVAFGLVLGSSCGIGLASAHGRGRAIEVFWSDPILLQRKLPAADRLAAEEELIRVFRDIGIEASFPSDSTQDGQDDGIPAFHVVLVARSGEGFRVSEQAMGANLEKALTNHTVFVFLPVILRVMGEAPGRGRNLVHDARKGRVLARAIGRVVAHEVAHAIDPRMPHGPADSIMSAQLTSSMLQKFGLSFDDASAASLRDAVDRIRNARLSNDASVATPSPSSF